MPSLKIAHVLLAPETRKAMSLPMAVLILGAVSQVDALIELVDRVCNPVFRRSMRTTDSAIGSRVAPGAGQ